MRRFLTLLILLLPLLASHLAASYITAIPVNELQSKFPVSNLNNSVRMLADQGYGILHYDQDYVIAITPATQSLDFTGSIYLADYPLQTKLYLIGNLSGEKYPQLGKAAKVLLELSSCVLIQSELQDTELRNLIRNPFTMLSMEPMRFPDDDLRLQAATRTRTDIAQMVSNVSETSVTSLLQGLQDQQTRYALADNHLAVANWIRGQFMAFGVSDTQLQSFTWNNTTQYNVVATIPGTVYPDQYIIIGGHHDSISHNSDPYVLAPGADDNGTGTVAALEIARVIMLSGYQPRTTIRFVTFAAEEFGLWGSKNYAQDALDNNQNIRLMINHDMIGNNTAAGDWLVRLMPYDGSMEHSAYASQIIEQYTDLTPYYGTMNSASSDSHSFWQRGYHVIYFFESDFSSVYHSAQDLITNLSPAYCTDVIKASIACTAVFAEMPSAPVGLSAHDIGDGSSIQLTWEDSGDPLINYYNVYHSTEMGNWGTPQTTSQYSAAITGLTQGQLYYFAVSAVDNFGNESYLVYATATPQAIPLQPQNFGDQPLYHSISLSWDDNGELDLAGYKLYRSQSEGVLGTQIGGLITDNSYLDTDVTGSQAYYYYSLCAVDNGNNASPFAQIVKSRPVTLDQGILIIDETENMSGVNPFQPTDIQVDDFYNAATEDFDVTLLDLNSLTENLRLADFGIYSSILWHGNDVASMDYPYFIQDALQQYIQMGGNILFSIYKPSMAFELNANYPASFATDSFINSVIGIASSSFESSARFNSAYPAYINFPLVKVDPDKTIANLNEHILNVEGIEPNADCINVYDYDSLYEDATPQGAMNGAGVGVLNLNHSGKVLTLSFPLYNMYMNQAKQLINHVFTTYFNEIYSAVDDPGAVPSPEISLYPSHPNPFTGTTIFRIEIKSNAQPLQVGVYNLRGQLVKQIYSGSSPKSVLLEWNGLDEQGNHAASGVYFIHATQQGNSSIRKVVLLR